MISGVLTALLVLVTSSQSQGSPELIDLLQRATEYVAQYEAELGNLIGSEEYLQNAVWLAPSQRGAPMVAKRLQRRVSSDFLIIQVGPNGQPLEKQIASTVRRSRNPNRLSKMLSTILLMPIRNV